MIASDIENLIFYPQIESKVLDAEFISASIEDLLYYADIQVTPLAPTFNTGAPFVEVSSLMDVTPSSMTEEFEILAFALPLNTNQYIANQYFDDLLMQILPIYSDNEPDLLAEYFTDEESFDWIQWNVGELTGLDSVYEVLDMQLLDNGVTSADDTIETALYFTLYTNNENESELIEMNLGNQITNPFEIPELEMLLEFRNDSFLSDLEETFA